MQQTLIIGKLNAKAIDVQQKWVIWAQIPTAAENQLKTELTRAAELQLPIFVVCHFV